MELHLKLIGWLLVALSLVHIVFPKKFDWMNELKSVSLMNRQLMYIHTFFIAFVVMLMGLLCITSANELMQTALGKKISFGLWLFWTVRLLVQFFGYSSQLWKGKRFETIVHIVFSFLWVYLSVVFWVVYMENRN